MYVIIAIIAAGFALFYCSYQIRLGAYVRSLCRNRAAGARRLHRSAILR